MKALILGLNVWPWTMVALYLLRNSRKQLPSGLWDTLVDNHDSRLYRRAFWSWLVFGACAVVSVLLWGPM